MTPQHVVIDTNVLISASLSPVGAPAQIVRRVLAHHILVFSDATFSEFKTRLWKPKFDRYLSIETRSALLHDFNAAAYWVNIAPELAAQKFSRDPDDDMFVHAALASGAPFLISGDMDLLALANQFKKHHALGIFAPANALGIIPGGA
jgi:putative PIN family toxin of toxin-antitoxin system